MIRATAEERALARAALYRLLALWFSYPTLEVRAALTAAGETAGVAAALLDDDTAGALVRLSREPASAGLEAEYQRVFTLSYSEECPPYETAFSARHIFQQTQQQADITGFYRAFGVDPATDRPDHLSLELEFGYLLAVKEAQARRLGEPDHVRLCRDAERSFLRDHLARWAPLIGQRVAVTAADSPYAAAGRLLVAFMAFEVRFLRLGAIEHYRDEPVLIADEPGEMTCPAADGAFTSIMAMAAKGGADE